MARLGTETAFEVLSKAKALERTGRSIIHLEIGEPDFSTPPHIVEAAVDALRGGWTHYSPSAGLPELREAIASYVSRTRGVAVAPDEVVVVPGGKPIMFYVMLALVDEGDEVIYPNPGFPIYESMIRYAGGTPVPIPLREERDFAMDVDEMATLITPSTKLIILNSPQNPTGGVLARTDIERAAAAIGERNILVLADEIYSRLQFEGQPFSIMSVPGMQERTILLDGFSKTYAMTGWRIGYGVMRADLAAQITRLMTNSNSCTASFTQRAAMAALEGDQSAVDRMRLEFERRSRAFVAGLNRIRGFSARMPKGAFYVFANITGTGWASKPLADVSARRGRRGRAFRHRVWLLWRGLSALQCRQFHGEPDGSADAHRRVGERAHVAAGSADFSQRRTAMSLRDVTTGLMRKEYSIDELREAARLMRGYNLVALCAAGSGHAGGTLSIMDIAAALYLRAAEHDPKHPDWPGRDRILWSAGHKAPALYVSLGIAGFCALDDIVTLRKLGSPFQGHPHWLRLPGVEISSGSLGQGLSIAVGMALAARIDSEKQGGKQHKIFCLMGDGEQQEGQVWEAAMEAGHFHLDNIIAVIDCNRLQIDGWVKDVMQVEPLAAKYAAFGWEVLRIDGHDMSQIVDAFEQARTVDRQARHDSCRYR